MLYNINKPQDSALKQNYINLNNLNYKTKHQNFVVR